MGSMVERRNFPALLTKKALTRLPRTSARGAKFLTSSHSPLDTSRWPALPETAKRVETHVSHRKQTTTHASTRDSSRDEFVLASTAWFASVQLRASSVENLIGTRERLEPRVSPRKQTIGCTSNRYSSREETLPLSGNSANREIGAPTANCRLGGRVSGWPGRSESRRGWGRRRCGRAYRRRKFRTCGSRPFRRAARGIFHSRLPRGGRVH